MASLNEELGYSPDERLLIINADDYGMCHSFNDAAQQLLLARAISSATIMVPCPWAKEAAAFCKAYPELDVGVHLTFTSEWEHYKWRPVTRDENVGSLVTDEGFFYATCEDFERHADAEHVRTEIFSQIEQAIAWGVKPTHLDIHMGSLYGLATGRDFLEIVFEACDYYDLPLRLPRAFSVAGDLPEPIVAMAKARIRSADEKGIVILDDLQTHPFHYTPGETYEELKQVAISTLRGLKPGVTEYFIHPGFSTNELQAIMPHAPKRDMEVRLFMDDEVRKVIETERIRLIHWRDLLELQREKRNR